MEPVSATSSIFCFPDTHRRLIRTTNYERPHQSLGYCTPADVHFAVNAPIL
ncbi:MAG: hypothetical protein H6656_00405 [Ardenticatenaceae bacterium]|nr:hypothetical protein [Ardenticatenaceae bacterium]